ncbi:proline iminopeptidase-family hydrolase [Liquorilactobacillus uvarum]|uniref:Proline iminopeptidase n=1 Tax=Liquorilactobacillus uvarum DSM 19971 TaxID=1423812 RepID=A0A0R1PSN5_9LACO|nr:proline iminopeptidase-family hydrolase [Liquorilactobacillus uvarum]KRL32754.1 prolyl aminopeptidase [Liquorilactobacillus uvarum DSM 19971]
MNYSKIVHLSNGNSVWTRTEGEGPIKMLLLHGGPGMTHEYLEPFSKFIKNKPIQIIYYEQLGSYYSDQPDDASLWNIPRFCEEVEEVRKAWGLENFYLYGQSWGGMLAMEYATRYGSHLRGLIDSNMVDDMKDYEIYINKLRDSMDSEDVAFMKDKEAKNEIDDPHYEELVMKLYQSCICRLNPWPDAVNRSFDHTNEQVYVTLQGPTEFTITGSLKTWSIRDRLQHIKAPTLLLGGEYDSMNPDVIRSMTNRFPNAQSHICPQGSHFSMWDDNKDYFKAIDDFLKKVEKTKP